MVVWTGNGYHVLFPFDFDRPFEHLQEFSKYSPQTTFHTLVYQNNFYILLKDI